MLNRFFILFFIGHFIVDRSADQPKGEGGNSAERQPFAGGNGDLRTEKGGGQHDQRGHTERN